MMMEENQNKHLFNGDWLEDKQTEKRFLIEIIENNTKKILKTKFLYSFPTLSKLNFHELVDGKDHYVLLVRLVNNMVLAGYSEQAL